MAGDVGESARAPGHQRPTRGRSQSDAGRIRHHPVDSRRQPPQPALHRGGDDLQIPHPVAAAVDAREAGRDPVPFDRSHAPVSTRQRQGEEPDPGVKIHGLLALPRPHHPVDQLAEQLAVGLEEAAGVVGEGELPDLSRHLPVGQSRQHRREGHRSVLPHCAVEPPGRWIGEPRGQGGDQLLESRIQNRTGVHRHQQVGGPRQIAGDDALGPGLDPQPVAQTVGPGGSSDNLYVERPLHSAEAL